MIVYRYLNLEYGLEALQTGEWKIGRLAELNDIFDCRPNMVPLRSTNPSITTDYYLKMLNGHNGLICYSGTLNDPVVWSHYADKHQGMALGFEFPDGHLHTPHKVRYAMKRPVLDLNDIGTSMDDKDPDKAQARLIETGFSSKHPSWEYELEYRHFVPLFKCQMRGKHYFGRLWWEHLKEVVLGARCGVSMIDVNRILINPTDQQRAQRAAPFLHAQVRQCRVNEDSYELAFVNHPNVAGL